MKPLILAFTAGLATAAAALATYQRSQPQTMDAADVPPLAPCTCRGRGRPCYACSTVGTDREDGSSYPTPPCATCGEPVYLTVSGAWRHVERDYAHEVAPEREVGSDDA